MPSLMIQISYLASAVLFILGLKRLSHPRTAVTGNMMGAAAMLLAVVVTLFDRQIIGFGLIISGLVVGSAVGVLLALKIQMTAMPQLVALFNGFGGGASVLVAGAALMEFIAVNAGGQPPGVIFTIAMGFSGIVGAVTFWGSLVAFAKLQGLAATGAVQFGGQSAVKLALLLLALLLAAWLVYAPLSASLYWAMVLCASLLGIFLVIAIGGADMPVVIALLNSYSGLAAAATGFVLANNLLIISGSLVGASGLILTNIMCRAMNRSLRNVLFGGLGGAVAEKGEVEEIYAGKVKSTSAEEVAMMLDGAAADRDRARLRHGRGPGPVCGQRSDAPSGVARKHGRIRDPSGGRSNAGAYERAAGRGRHPLREVKGDGRNQRLHGTGGYCHGDRGQRRGKPGCQDPVRHPPGRYAGHRCGQGPRRGRHQAQPQSRIRRNSQPAVCGG